jgi:two-component system phosphate regulon sensor histidine kinase PhoR
LLTKKDKSVFSRTTFWKVFPFLFLFFMLSSWLLFQRQSQKETHQSDEAMIFRARTVADGLEKQIIFDKIDALEPLIGRIPSDRTQIERFLGRWLEDEQDVISVSLWTREDEWPIRSTRPEFWNLFETEQIAPEDRQSILASLFPNESSFEDNHDPWYIRHTSLPRITKYPMFHLGIRTDDAQSPLILEILFDSTFIQESMKDIAKQEEVLFLQGESGNVFLASNEEVKLPENMPGSGRVKRAQGATYVAHRLTYLPWKLIVKEKTPSTTSLAIWQDRLFWITTGGGFILSVLLSLLLAVWIDYPQIKLSKTITEIARGDFARRLPAQKNLIMGRLVKLFNYMAEEMDRLQRMDVSEIINEKNKTETILKHIADGVVVTDPDDRILVINAVAEKWFGLDERDVFHKSIRQCIKNRPLISLLQEVKDGRLQSSGEFSFNVVTTNEKKTFQAHAARVHNPEDKLIGVVTVIRDITKEKEADRIKTELVSMVAHELKSPLTSIYGFSELLLDSKLKDPKADEYAKVILNESTRLTDLVNKYLDLARLESGRIEMHMHSFDLRHVVKKIVEVYKNQTAKKDIRVITEIPRKLPTVYGDPDMIEQVMLNLFSNAVKYSPQHSKIGIEAKTNDKEIIVSVIDNGYGIPKESIDRIFDKFYRATESEAAEEVEGTGLGLSLAKEIVEKHGGTINVNSRMGVGTIFSFTLPKEKRSIKK